MIFGNKTIASVKAGLRSLMPTCRDASRLQSDALDHPLPIFKRSGLWMHLLVCKWCRRYGRQIRFLRNAALEHPDQLAQASTQKLTAEARERIKISLRDNNNSENS
jgi:hypothetical protein